MNEPMSAERLDELVDIDPLQLRDAAVTLLRQRDAADRLSRTAEMRAEDLKVQRDEARAQVERLRAEREIDLAALRVAAADLKHVRAERDAAWTVVREGAANMRGLRATLTAERDAARTDAGLRRDERDRLAEQVKRARARHTGVCSGACGLDDACECEDRDLICGEDNERWPCPTIRDLDGTEE